MSVLVIAHLLAGNQGLLYGEQNAVCPPLLLVSNIIHQLFHFSLTLSIEFDFYDFVVHTTVNIDVLCDGGVRMYVCVCVFSCDLMFLCVCLIPAV